MNVIATQSVDLTIVQVVMQTAILTILIYFRKQPTGMLPKLPKVYYFSGSTNQVNLETTN